MSGFASQTQGRTLAVVSLSINDFAGSLQGWNNTRTSSLMTAHAAGMVRSVEQQFAGHWNVIPAESFVGRPDYQSLAGPPREVAVPFFPQGYMPLFGLHRPDLVGARIPAEKAQALSAMLGADFIVVVYAEWGVKTGSFVPTSKALSKNVITIFDASGREIYHGRRDVMGERTLGAFGGVVVDENSITEWVNAFHRGIAELLAG
ncbi:MAG: hypothetical protein H5U40_01335 [Polyangiaceae bacterium]|nr:hypothetical protein [Polyangiaceae bacterium]